MGAVPLEAVGGIEPPGAAVLPQDEHKGVAEAVGLQAAEGLLKEQAAVPLAPVVRVGVEGDDLPQP